MVYMDYNGSSDEGLWPAGLRVAVIENNSVYRLLIEQLLLQCNYKANYKNSRSCENMIRENKYLSRLYEIPILVASYTQVQEAISFITKNQQSFELVITDVFFPSEDALLILQEITLKLNIPTIIMSWTGDTRTVMKYIVHGACDFIIKPVRVKELRNIWQHVFRKQMANQLGAESKSKLYPVSEESNSYIPSLQVSGPREVRGIVTDIRDLKKPRLQWTRQLHQQFIAAISEVGLEKATPKKVLEMMHVKHLTREQVASHLQKYRLYLKRSSRTITRDVAISSASQNSGSPPIEAENNPSSSPSKKESNPSSSINLDQSNNGMEITDYSYYKGESSSGSHCVIGDPNDCFDEAFHDINWASSEQESGSFFWNFSI